MKDLAKVIVMDYAYLSGLAIAVFTSFLAAAYGLSFLLKRIGARKSVSENRVFRLIAGSQKTVLIIVGVITSLGTLNVDVSALVAGLGLTGFAVGLALKDAISNLVAGVMIIIYKPFNLGDEIEIMGSTGAVSGIDLRYITLKTDESVALIPNSAFLANKLIKKNPAATQPETPTET